MANLTWWALRARMRSYFPKEELGRGLFVVTPGDLSLVVQCWNTSGADLGKRSDRVSSWVVDALAKGFRDKYRPDSIERGVVDVNFRTGEATVELFYTVAGQKLRVTEQHRWK